MAATIKLVAENGIHATPMSQVSKHANVAAGTIYHYFENKNDLIQKTYLSLKKLKIEAILKNDQPENEYKTRFIDFWLTYYEQLLFDGHLLFLEQCAISPIIDDQTAQQAEFDAKPVREFLLDGIAKQKIKSISLPLLYSITYGSVASVARLEKLSRESINLEMREQAAEMCWDGLKYAG